jgi:uncharacterized protein (DUF1778 family)
MPQTQTKPHARRRIMAFRLSQAEYQMLANAARYEKRKMADLVYLIVADALEKYARRLPSASNPSPSTES